MSIVTISRGSLKNGTEVAEKVAEMLGYECLDREILIEASEQFNIPEVKLNRALENAPRFFDRLTFGKDTFVSYFRNALLERLGKDNVVYHGNAGQFFLEDVTHVLKVRIISTFESRVKDVMERDGITEKAAAQFLQKIDDARKKWSQHFYGIHIEDPSLYDLVININNLTVEEAADLIVNTLHLPRFQSTPESKQQFEGLKLASRARAALAKRFPKAVVTSRDGTIIVSNEGLLNQQSDMDAMIKEALQGIEGIQEVVTKVWPIADPY